ncbi:FeoA family protein [Pseudoalteromonas tunicata]|uniref:FeoA family protein n=1 Tax=Pseudoalteromonas tunicata TaxID=314281 RepID=UPI00273D284E|nr:FeoA family protein [Pseudoalteromonas tunicata]MDP5214934.1 FeoA family protein [Pseudoalteromonas tunicata]
MTRLNQISLGAAARIVSFDNNNNELQKKLLAMGLIPGSLLEVIRFAPLGDPMVLKVRGSSLSLRKAEADSIFVELV